MRAFVAGATGYVGRAITRLCAEHGIETFAHVRPDSSRLPEHRERFEGWGAVVDTTPWEEEAMTERMRELACDLVFCCVGTTRARRKVADDPDDETYEKIDYGLTALLARACVDAEVLPRFVYLSAAGSGPRARGAYMRARHAAETYIIHTDLPYTIVRPSFITGRNREENRPAEYWGAKVADAALFSASLVGFVGLRRRFRSTDDVQLATAMIAWGLDPEGERRILEGDDLRGHTLEGAAT